MVTMGMRDHHQVDLHDVDPQPPEGVHEHLAIGASVEEDPKPVVLDQCGEAMNGGDPLRDHVVDQERYPHDILETS